MKISSPKEKILKEVKKALSNPVPLPFPKSEENSSDFNTMKKISYFFK